VFYATLIIPALEIMAGGFLILKIFKNASAVILLILMFVFTSSLGIVIHNGYSFECNCFGPLSLVKNISYLSIVFNTIIIFLLAILVIHFKPHLSVIREEFMYVFTGTVFIAVIGIVPLKDTQMSYEINSRRIKSIM
ncbi:MauE/DoxX family redox-associated membrane protein, partial [candidate division KSB1 bacterium]